MLALVHLLLYRNHRNDSFLYSCLLFIGDILCIKSKSLFEILFVKFKVKLISYWGLK